MPLYEIATVFKSLKITVKCTEGLGRLLILTCSALHELLLFIRLCYHEPWGKNVFLMPTADKLSCDRLCLHSGFEWNEERNDWIYFLNSDALQKAEQHMLYVLKGLLFKKSPTCTSCVVHMQ